MLANLTYLKKSKFESLTQIIFPHIVNQKYGQFNLYFDVRNLFRKLYTEQNQQYINEFLCTDIVYDKTAFISELLNTVAHYKKYFEKYGTVNVFIYFNTKPSKYHTEINPDYKSYYYDKHLNENGKYANLVKYFEKSLGICKTITGLLKHVHMFDTGDMDADIVPYEIMNKIPGESNKYHVIFGYSMKYLTYLNYHDNVWLMHLTNDNVYFANRNEGQVDYLNKELNSESMKKVSGFNDLHNYIIPTLAMAGVEKYGIRRVENYTPYKLINLVKDRPEHYPAKTYSDVKKLYNIQDHNDDLIKRNISQLSLSLESKTHDIERLKSQFRFTDNEKQLSILNKELFNNKLYLDSLIK